MKKILAIVLVVALTAAVSIAGTMAFLTSTDSDVNVMTLGQAKIEQIEKQRVDMTHQDQQTPAELEDWQISALMPAVNTNGGAANDPAVWMPGRDADEAYVNFGDLVNADITGAHWAGIWDSSLKNVKDKFVFVKNTGTVDVYYRTIILYEYDETKAVNSYGQDMIHFNINGNSRFTWFPDNESDPMTVTVNGEVYGVMVATYNIPLKPNTVSRPSLLQVGLDGDATNEIVAQFGDTYDILVLSQAVQTTGFATADAALTAGFGAITEANLQTWFGGTSINDDIADDEAAKDALTENKETIVVNLTGDVTYDIAAWNSNAMGGSSTKNIIINGNGHTITFNNTNSDWNNVVTGDAVLTINNATVTNSGYDATSGTWNAHDIVFADKVVLNDVVFENAIALMDDATLTNITLTDDSSSDAYGIWIRPSGQTVTIDGLKMDMTGTAGTDRGIKIDNEYSEDEDQGVTLTVKNAQITTEKKAAILVKSNANVTITTENITFSGSTTTNIVEVDSDVAANAANILHNGAAAPVEG